MRRRTGSNAGISAGGEGTSRAAWAGRVLTVGSVALAIGCAAPGLPPAGPAPGEVDVGYGARPAASANGSLRSISDEEAVGAGVLTLPELLRGRVPGLQVIKTPNGFTYRIRGQNSMLLEQAPLFVVNGVPTDAEDVDNAMAGLLMEDVRQVDVLKDVASTSIFGSRGAGGVILITTRR